MRRAGLAAVLLLVLPMGGRGQGPSDPEPAPPGADLIAEFTSERAGGDRAVTFRWSFSPPGDGETRELTCTINPDGDQVYEASLPDCEDDTSFRHVYEEAGVYQAVLVARSREGATNRATTRVRIGR